MSKIKELVNTTRQILPVEVDGVMMYLPPRASVCGVNVTNLNMLRGRASIVEDLSEVVPATTRRRGRGRKLNG